jgi:hexosaminidase
MTLYRLLFFIFLSLLLHTQGASVEESALRYPVIPKPASLIPIPGDFKAEDSLALWINASISAHEALSSSMIELLSSKVTVDIHYGTPPHQLHAPHLYLHIDPEADIPAEGYILHVTSYAISLEASTVRGAFWGWQTLQQLLFSPGITVPKTLIYDFPRFAYRGLHLDVARHMFPVSFIKKYIDLMAYYKLNTFHWHLTDDQGWRIEIKQYPKLQEIGAYRNETLLGHAGKIPRKFDKTRYGGYYTQQDIKEIVEYAKQRQVDIIPEIDMPGHTLSALAAYPELSCHQTPLAVSTSWGIFEDVLCVGNEKTFTFLEDVLTEVMELFPGKYIHIGGDEVSKKRWKKCSQCQKQMQTHLLRNEVELQSYFIERIEKFLNAHGRQIIGWDEILEGGVQPSAMIMCWTDAKEAIQAAQKHHPVIMTPCKYLYFDYYQSRSPREPLAIGHCTTLKQVYHYEPIPDELNKEDSQWIYGVQGCVWTEYIKTPKQVEYMTYPRAIALAEIAWSPPSNKYFPDFLIRLKYHSSMLKAAGVHYASHAFEE